MKEFGVYQYVEGEPMTERDKKEVGSKFWNKGKWDNFVAPFLPKDCDGMTFVDMGCNAGLFLEQAEKMGFGRVIGVDSDKDAMQKAISYRDRIGGKYELRHQMMEKVIDELPVADYTVLANSHYYFLVGDWLEYLDKLKLKTRYCIIVTADKRAQVSMASSDVGGIHSYFKDWRELTTDIDPPTLEGDPHPRQLWGLCFESMVIERTEMATLDNGNHVQDNFYEELDEGKHYRDTKYYRIIRKYRLVDRANKWSESRLKKYMQDRVNLYEDVKKNGLLNPIIVNSNNRVVDGNHRFQIMRHLGNEYIPVRRVT